MNKQLKRYIDELQIGISLWIFPAVESIEQLDTPWRKKDNDGVAPKLVDGEMTWPWPKVGEIPGDGHVRHVTSLNEDYIKMKDGWVKYANHPHKVDKIDIDNKEHTFFIQGTANGYNYYIEVYINDEPVSAVLNIYKDRKPTFAIMKPVGTIFKELYKYIEGNK